MATKKKDTLTVAVEKLVEKSESEKAREYISKEYPYLAQDSVTGLLMAILIEIVKWRISK